MAISNDGRELLDKMFSLVQTPETRAASAGMKTTNVAAAPRSIPPPPPTTTIVPVPAPAVTPKPASQPAR
ncbi:MAG: hypothetical protein JGK26_31155 [Microcoleus sp. PH2017_27_LUM_O_A]|uniref:hypothetical protein n=1 Tax=Microcoleus sp. PH2017_27_LUM_O_A TaxID=2798837 RepID=UPI001DEBC683|nr:hypothetical protein [Microcoleus sp. PH2017_27_LUM_O_A]MCC3563474.1 hypothetical protein [Microcoleus sp. PH2017_27_LUM_O_A]